MSTFEKIFEVFYATAAIMWSSYLVASVLADNDKMNLERLLSVLIMSSLTVFILAKLAW